MAFRSFTVSSDWPLIGVCVVMEVFDDGGRERNLCRRFGMVFRWSLYNPIRVLNSQRRLCCQLVLTFSHLRHADNAAT